MLMMSWFQCWFIEDWDLAMNLSQDWRIPITAWQYCPTSPHIFFNKKIAMGVNFLVVRSMPCHSMGLCIDSLVQNWHYFDDARRMAWATAIEWWITQWIWWRYMWVVTKTKRPQDERTLVLHLVLIHVLVFIAFMFVII